jgi:hypothetical protein
VKSFASKERRRDGGRAHESARRGGAGERKREGVGRDKLVEMGFVKMVCV